MTERQLTDMIDSEQRTLDTINGTIERGKDVLDAETLAALRTSAKEVAANITELNLRLAELRN